MFKLCGPFYAATEVLVLFAEVATVPVEALLEVTVPPSDS